MCMIGGGRFSTGYEISRCQNPLKHHLVRKRSDAQGLEFRSEIVKVRLHMWNLGTGRQKADARDRCRIRGK